MQVIIANNLVFDVCESIKIEKSVEVLTNTAKITLPREFKNGEDSNGNPLDFSYKSILDFMKRGDSIQISLGYDGNNQTEFQGYITKIGADTPLVLECEDEMYQLKKAPRITKYIKSGSLIEILKAVIPSKYNIELNEDYNYGSWHIDNATPYEVLEELKERTGLRAYFITPDTLSVGMKVDFKPRDVHQFNFSENVRRDTDLSFERKDDKLLEVTVKSRQKNGEELSETVGEKGGNTVNMSMVPNMTKADLKKWAEQIYKSRSIDGFEGSLNSWCEPRTQPGDSAEIYRPIYEDGHQNGRYFIEAVTIDLNGDSGIRRTNKLSYKL
jgi:hypothetical protein